jgi:Gly-Xaa carboxypeptidase
MKMQKLWGALVAQPGVAEKGAIDVHITIRMPGGHSSVPPPHTSIGVLSELIQAIEADTYPTYLNEKNPYYGTIVCGGAYAPKFPESLKEILSHDKRDSKSCTKKDLLAEEAAKESLFHKYLMTTSIAVDVVSLFLSTSTSPRKQIRMLNK